MCQRDNWVLGNSGYCNIVIIACFSALLIILIIIFVCVGLVTQLPQDFFSFLLEVQNKLAKVIKSVGKIEHSSYPFQSHIKRS